MMPSYSARDLAAMDKETLWNIPDGPVEVVFDPLPDGTPQVLLTDSRLTIYSAYMWALYNEFPNTPAKITHHIGDLRNGNRTHMTLMNRVLWDCYRAYEGELDLEDLCKILYESTNRIYNDFSTMIESEVSTASIEDLVDVVDHPEIAEAIDAIDGFSPSINRAHEVATKVLKDPTALPGNPVSAAMRSGLVDSNQLMQSLVARGKVSDIDSRFFNEPIPSSFLSGMNSLYESMTESRTSTKAAAYKEKPIEDSEYFNRKLQLMAATVNQLEWVSKELEVVSTTLDDQQASAGGLKILPGDCGTTRHVRWTVRAKDLDALEGKYYVDKTSPTGLNVITENDKDLVGQTLLLRSPTLCEHVGPQSICATCYGALALSLPRGTTMGHVASVDYGERVTQNMLSIKHVDFAGEERQLSLSSYEREFMEAIPGTRFVRFKQNLVNKRLILSVAAGDVEQLPELEFVQEDVTELPVGRISEIGHFYLTIEDAKGERETVNLSAEVEGKKSHFTHAFLEHIRQNGYTLSDSGRFLIEVSGFNIADPLFEVPNRDVNILDYLKSIVQFITSTEDKDKKKLPGQDTGPKRMLKNSRTIEEAIMAFHELTSVKMKVNIVHLEILIYSTMVRSTARRDFRLPYQGNALIFEQLSRVIQNRSLGGAMAFEGHSKILLDPATYTNRLRTDHILDDLLLPRNAAQPSRGR